MKVRRVLLIAAPVVASLLVVATVQTRAKSGTAQYANPSIFRPRPYLVSCVVRAFVREGISLHDVLPGSAARLGRVSLQPDRHNVIFEVTVTATPRKAEALLAQARATKKLYPKLRAAAVPMRDGNLYISYRDRAQAKRLVSRALGRLPAVCGHS